MLSLILNGVLTTAGLKPLPRVASDIIDNTPRVVTRIVHVVQSNLPPERKAVRGVKIAENFVDDALDHVGWATEDERDDFTKAVTTIVSLCIKWAT